MDIILNGFVIIMLGFTIGYCLKLNRNITELKNSRKELIELVKTFDTTMIDTHKSIANLKEIANTAAVELKNQIGVAEELNNDLSFMNNTASKMADKMEKMIDLSRLTLSEISGVEMIEEIRGEIEMLKKTLTKKTSKVSQKKTSTKADVTTKTKSKKSPKEV